MWLERVQTEGLLQAAVAYGYFPCVSEGNDLVILDEGGGERARFRFPRQRRDRRLCLADFFRPSGVGPDRRGGAASWSPSAGGSARPRPGCSPRTPTATTWSCTACRCSWPRRWPSTGTRGSAARWASAATTRPTSTASCGCGYQGCRYSFGYPACPNLEDRATVMRLLGAERIGVTLSEEFQLAPEQSTDALIAHHPEAKYFSA